jgi:alkaline phosphatase D
MKTNRFFRLLVGFALGVGSSLVAQAQNGFTHGPDGGIEASFFDTSLAPFYHGVASGDPLDDRVILWTRVTPATDTVVSVSWKVATDTAFRNVVRQGQTTTDYTKDYTVKVDADGLQPGVTYYYYFSALGRNSLIGRTRTIPGMQVSHLRFAVVSCSNYQMGYFNGYKRIAARNDVDAVLHLGDYIYEYPLYGYGYTAAVGRGHRPTEEILTLDDYRIRHSFYKLDPDLRAAHQQTPFITIWDDHEIANNTWEHGAANHDSTTEGDFETRKQSAIRAYLEWMPIRHPDFTHNAKIYRQFSFGTLANVLMLDTRVENRDKQAISAADPALQDTSRRLIGDVQRQWLFDKMDQSPATWQILGNQVMFSEEGPGLDTWTGYLAERQMVMDKFYALGHKNNVVLTGDTHRSWAWDIADKPFDTAHYQPFTGRYTAGVEIAAPSVASPNRDESSPGTSQEPTRQSLYNANPHLRYNDQDNHGYVMLDVTAGKLQADFFFVDTKVRSAKDSFAIGWFTYKNEGYLRQATAPAAANVQQSIPAPPLPAGFPVLSLGTAQVTAGYILSGIYPNPAREQVFIGLVLNKSTQLNIRLTDPLGKTLLAHQMNIAAGNQKVVLNLPQLPAGTYLLQVQDGNGNQQVRKLLVN